MNAQQPLVEQLEADANRYFEADDLVNAVAAQEQAVLQWKVLGDHEKEALSARKAGCLYFALGKHAQALNLYERALQIHIPLGARRDAAVSQGKIGELYQHIGRHKEAVVALEKARQYAIEASDSELQGAILNNLGVSYRELGKSTDAIHVYEAALTVWGKVNSTDGIASTMHNLGAVYMDRYDYDHARPLLMQAMCSRDALNDMRGLCRTYIMLGRLFEAQSNHLEAVQFFEKALHLAQHPEVNSETLRAEALHNLAGTSILCGNSKLAIQLLTEAKNAVAISGNLSAQGIILYLMGAAYQNTGDLDTALNHLHEAQLLQEQIDDRIGLTSTMSLAAHIQMRKGDYIAAVPVLERAASLYNQIGNPSGEGQIYKLMAQACKELGQTAEAAAYSQYADFLTADFYTDDAKELDEESFEFEFEFDSPELELPDLDLSQEADFLDLFESGASRYVADFQFQKASPTLQ